MLTLLAPRVLSRSLKISNHVSRNAVRTFLATPSISLPAGRPPKNPNVAKTSTARATSTSTRKTASPASKAKKPATRRAPGRPILKKKKGVATVAARKKRKPRKTIAKKKPTRMRILKSDKPPPAAPNAYIIFFKKYITGLGDAGKAKSLQDTAQISKNAAGIWHALSDAEKQPFIDEHAALREEYIRKREAYFREVPSKVLTELNRRRVKAGKQKIRKHIAPEDKRPITGFFRFLHEYRTTDEAQAIARDNTPPSGGRQAYNIELVKAAGTAWRAMSDGEKEGYIKAYGEEFKKWKEERGEA